VLAVLKRVVHEIAETALERERLAGNRRGGLAFDRDIGVDLAISTLQFLK
jgi:hypothetical protein